MKKLIKHILFFFLVLLPTFIFSQVITMSNGNGSGCGGTFLDPGGAGNYADNLNQTYTLCPSIPGEHVQINFSDFNIELNNDHLIVYNGNSTAAPVIGNYSGNIGPGYIQASNASGCLTFVFTSNGSVNSSGWTASIDCGLPCQTIIADATTGPVDADGFVNICQGQAVTFTGTGTYPQNNTNYNQSDGTSTFNWDFGNGQTGTGQVVQMTFGTAGIQDVDLTIVDANGCVSTNDINIFVQVPDVPDFTGTQPMNQTICLGDTNVLTGVVNPNVISLEIPPITGTFPIPNGTGILNSGNVINAFNNGTNLTNVNNLDEVCIELEHSNLADLNISLICPNGQSVVLHTAGSGSGLYVGNPVPVGTGNGFQYCFAMGSSSLLDNGATVVSGTPPGNSVQSGSYLPVGNFSSLVGCPLNGNWTVQVTDVNAGANDGNFFGWEINFDPYSFPPGVIFIPNITSSGWVNDPTIVSTNGDNITVSPLAPGTACYDYQAIDEFGCPYVQQVCFTVLGPGQGGCPQCFITNFTANSVLVQCTDQYTTTGIIEFVESPSSGNLVVEDCQGNTAIVDTYPFSSPANYTLVGTNGDGLACWVRAYFTGDTSCNASLNFLLPQAYPGDEVGDFNASITGYSTHNYILCNTDIFNAQSTGNWVIPTVPPNIDPGVGYLIYRCPPALTGFGVDPFTDPCYVTTLTSDNISLINNGGSLDAFLQSLVPLTNNTFYVVPMSFYSVSNQVINNGCYDLDFSKQFTVQYLNPITTSSTQDCYLGTATIIINGGGYSEFYGGNFTASNLNPPSASFVNTSTTAGGTITIQNLHDGENYSFSITDGNGCPQIVTGTFIGPEDASFSYSAPGYCVNASNPTPTVNGVQGGTFSTNDVGITLNPVTGEIDIASSSPGTYTIYYQSPAATCFGTDSAEVVIADYPVVVAGNDTSVCEGQPVVLFGSGAFSYVWDNGVTNGVSFYPPLGTTMYNVVGTDQYGCSGNSTITVTVNPNPFVEAGNDQVICLNDQATVQSSGDVGLTYNWTGGIFDGIPFSPLVGSNKYYLTGTDPITGCFSLDSVTILVNPLPNVNAGADIGVCIGNSATLNASGAPALFWDNGITNGVSFIPLVTTTYTVTGIALGCVNTDQVTVTVFNQAAINAGPDSSICIGGSAILSATGGEIYTWDNGLGMGNDFEVFPGITTTYAVSGIDTNGCSGSDTVIITVNPLPIIDAGNNQTVCFGQFVTLTGSGGISYSWDQGVIDNQPFYPPLGTTMYSVIGTDINGCQNADMVSVTTTPLPSVDAGVAQTVCSGGSVTLFGTGSGTLTWDQGVQSGIPFIANSTTVYTLTSTDGLGCQNIDQVTVTVNPLPPVNAGPDLVLCFGQPTTITATGAISYTWNNGISNGVQFNPIQGTTSYIVNGIDAFGCTNSDSVNVLVNPIPNPIITGSNQYCVGFMANLAADQVYNSYLWSTGDVTQSTNVTIADNPISLTVTNSFGCSASVGGLVVIENPNLSTSSIINICQGQTALIHGVQRNISGVYVNTSPAITGCDSTSTITLIVHALPNVNAGNDYEVCYPDSVILAAGGAITYVWDNGAQNGIPFLQNVGTFNFTVIGTDNNGCQNTDQIQITVNPIPAINAGNDTSICFGSSITLTGSGGVSYLWNFGVIDGINFTPLVSNIYSVTGTDANGCQFTDAISVIINPLPIVDAGPPQSLCEGGQVALTGSGAVSFVWDQGVQNGVFFTPPSGISSYAVTGTDANGCQNSDQTLVTVYGLPTINAGPDQNFCAGNSATLSASGGVSYVWSGGIQNGVAFSPNVGTYTYTVVGTSLHGCINSDTVSIVVNPSPIVNAGNDLVVCIGTFVTLNGSGANFYNWDNGIVNGASFAPDLGLNTYIVTGTDANGCTDTDTVTVTVNPPPSVDAGNDIEVCEGEIVTLHATGAPNITWSNNIVDGVPFIPTQSQTYSVTGTVGTGCSSQDFVTVIVHPIPVVNLSPSTTFGCAPLTVTLTNNTDSVFNCVWTLGDGSVINDCGPITHTFDEPGCFDVNLDVTSVNGCPASILMPDLICVEALPIANFTASPTTMTNMNTTSQMTNLSFGADHYVWLFGDGQNSLEENPAHTFPSDQVASYDIILVAYSPSGCPDTAKREVSITKELIFYVPNTFTPDGDEINASFTPMFTSGINVNEYTLLIFNRWGEVIFESHNPSVGWNGRYGGEGGVLVQDDVYVWKIYYKQEGKQELNTVVGHVNVLK